MRNRKPSLLYLQQNLAEIKKLARLIGAARVHTLNARPDSVLYFVNPSAEDPAGPLDSDELHLEFPDPAVLFLAVFPIRPD